MPNIVEALSKLENELSSSLSLESKIKVIASFKDKELLNFLIEYRYGDKYLTYKDTTVKRVKAIDEEKKWWNYQLPVNKIVGTFKRFSYLRRILESGIGEDATIKFEKLKNHCYRQEWKLYKRIINKEFFNSTIIIHGEKDQISLIPSVILQTFGIGSESVKFMKCDDGKPSFPCFIEPKLPGMRVRLITGESFKAFTIYKDKLLTITSYFPSTYCQISEKYSIDGIIKDVKFGSDSDRGLVGGLIPKLFIFDCCNDEKLTYIERKKFLLRVASVIPHITIIPFIEVSSLEEAIKFKDNCIRKGYRGAILKQRNSFYKPTYSNKWIDISDKSLTTVKIIAIIGNRTCESLIVRRNGIECVAKIKEIHQDLLWKQKHIFLGKYCCIDKDNCFIKFNPNKA